ncbi:hypothetical protein ABZP36_034436 [Zizania latifolia]
MHGKARPAGGVAALLLPILAVLLLADAAAADGYDHGRVTTTSAAAHRRAVVVGDGVTMYALTIMGRRRRLEEEVAPELPAVSLANGGSNNIYGTLMSNQQTCPGNGCAGKKPGEPYTRPCTYDNRCGRP